MMRINTQTHRSKVLCSPVQKYSTDQDYWPEIGTGRDRRNLSEDEVVWIIIIQVRCNWQKGVILAWSYRI